MIVFDTAQDTGAGEDVFDKLTFAGTVSRVRVRNRTNDLVS